MRQELEKIAFLLPPVEKRPYLLERWETMPDKLLIEIGKGQLRGNPTFFYAIWRPGQSGKPIIASHLLGSREETYESILTALKGFSPTISIP